MEKNTSIIDEWIHKLASRGCPISQDEMRAMFTSGIESTTAREVVMSH